MAKKRKKKMDMGTLIGLGVVGFGAYLLWRELQEDEADVIQPTVITDSMLPGTLVPSAAGVVQPQLPAPVALSQEFPSQVIPQQAVPRPQPLPYVYSGAQEPGIEPGVAEPFAIASEMTKQQYLEMLGKPKPRSTVTGPLPPPGLFPKFKGKAGPKQKACLTQSGAWTGPTGRKFCVMPG